MELPSIRQRITCARAEVSNLFILILCLHGHVKSTQNFQSPGCFVPPCESRKQDAAVNGFLDEWIDDGLLCVPLPKIEAAKEVAIYVLHGATRDQEGKRTLFLELAAPDSELQLYRWHCSFAELRQSYLADSRKLGSARPVEDKAKPKPKKRKDSEAENE